MLLTRWQPPCPSPPTPALLGLQWDPCVTAGWPTCGLRFPRSQPCRGWGFKGMTALYLYICRQRPAKALLILDTCKVRATGGQPAPGQEAAPGRKRVGRREEQRQPLGCEHREQGELLSSFALEHTLTFFNTGPKPHEIWGSFELAVAAGTGPRSQCGGLWLIPAEGQSSGTTRWQTPRAAQNLCVLAGFHLGHIKPNTAKQRWGRIGSVLKQTNKNAFSKARLIDLI